MALLSGEPGIGKTRLATYAALEARAQGATVLYGRCDEELGLPHGRGSRRSPTWSSTRPTMLLAPRRSPRRRPGSGSSPRWPARPDAPAPRQTDPETERYLMWGAVLGLLVEAAAETPIALVIDDLHWADRPTLALLRHLVVSAPQAWLLVIGAYRDSDSDARARAGRAAGRAAPRARRRAHRAEGPRRPDVIALMEAAAGHDLDDTGHALALEVVAETDGNPFFVAEILRHLDETGALYRGDDGRWALRGPLTEIGLPQSVREVIGRRVERLGDEAARVLGIAAVIGRDFDLDLLARVSDAPEDALLDVLDQAVEASILEEVGDPPGRFAFSHALVNHTLYEALGPTRRARAAPPRGRGARGHLRRRPGRAPGRAGPALGGGDGHGARSARRWTYARRRGRRRWPTWRPPRRCAGSSARSRCSTTSPTPTRPSAATCRSALGEAKRQLADPGFRERCSRRRGWPATWATPTAWPARRWPTRAARSARSAGSTATRSR